ncbi:MAG: DUF58 domain-containing protein [Acidimicrobiales bacterium]
MASAPLLSPGLLAQLEQLQLVTRRRLAGRFAGEHRSPAFGSSVDFADYREYHPGDDFRRIDYPLYARTGALFIRLFEAEDNVTVRIVIDRSASMGMHRKLDQAVRMAAAIGFIALVRRDIVVVHTEPASGPARRFSGRHATQPLFTMLAELAAAGPTDLVGAAREVLGQRGPVGVNVLITDLLSDGWSTAVDRLVACGGDTTVLHVLAPDELRPDLRGDLEMVDVETGQQVNASLSPAALSEYAENAAAWLAETSGHCRSRGAAYVRVMADEPPEGVLLRSWREHGLVR